MRKLALLLAILMILSLSVISCAEKTDESVTDESSVTEVDAEESELWYSADYLPNENYEGYQFRFVTVASLPSHVEQQDGDIVNDAYYTRNLVIGERYNVKFTQKDVADYQSLTSTFRKSATANSDDFDLCRIIMRDAFSNALSGYIASVDELEYVDISQPWYIQYVNEELTIGGKLYFAYSDECIDAFMGSMCVFFNQSLTADLNLSSPYDLVANGKWTIDNFYAGALAAVYDINNDNKYTLEDDRWGIISEHDMLIPSMWIGAGLKTIEKDSDMIPYFSAHGNERMYDILKKVYDYWVSDGVCYDSFLKIGYDEKNRITARNSFINGMAMYIVNSFGTASTLRDMEKDFGIVPLPKYDEEQEIYYSRLCDGWINVPPTVSSNLVRTSVIMEALAIESKNYVIPAIYENALLNKFIRDETSVKMVEEYIMKNRMLDLGDSIWMDPVRNIFMACFTQKKPDFASAAEKDVKIVEKTIETAMKKISE